MAPISSVADPILDRLKVLHPKAIDLSLDRVWRLMAALGHPERSLPPVIHVAGTNGKGSTVATLRAVLEAAGHRVHVYTSPHLVRFSERIRLAGSIIDEAALAEILEEIERRNAGEPITFFEVTTAAAFLAFARTPADVTLLETGMGGRLDATNIIDRPLATVITPISYDHMQFLGTTLAEIAGEKAGILKRGVPAVTGVQPDEAQAVLTARAAAVGAVPVRRGTEWQVEARDDGFRYRGCRTVDLPRPSLPGRHQIDNAALAIATLDHIEALKVDDAAMRAGLAAVEWPARLQRLTRGPLPALLPPGAELFLDGGHNEAAGEILADWAKANHDKPLDVVFAMISTKSPEAFLAHLAPYARRLRAVAIPGEPLSLPADVTAAAAQKAGIRDAAAAASTEAAVADLVARAAGGPPPRVLVCGSLYYAGTVLAENS
jgi:dihydrofolate synthase / folylpolyglutamate synthase